MFGYWFLVSPASIMNLPLLRRGSCGHTLPVTFVHGNMGTPVVKTLFCLFCGAWKLVG